MAERSGLALVGALLLLGVGACESGEAASRVDQARTAYQQGHLDEARELFEHALSEDARDVNALVGLVDIHLDRGELERAGQRFAVLDGLELDRRGEQLVTRARSRYYEMMYEAARGRGPAQPADPAAYDEALIALFNLAAEPAHNDELVERFALQARVALGADDPSQPLDATAPELERASLEQLEAALDGYHRITDRDPRLNRVLDPDEAVRREAERVIPALERRLFERRLDARFESELRPRLIEQGRFDPDAGVLVIRFESPEPYPEERPEGDALDALRQELALALVMEELTDLAYELRGTERPGDADPIPLGRTDDEVTQAYQRVEVTSFELARDGIVTMELRVPYDLLPRTAWRLEQYLAWTAERAATAALPGSGEGSGAP